MSSLEEYRRLEFDLITLFKLVNSETTIEFDNDLYLMKKAIY